MAAELSNTLNRFVAALPATERQVFLPLLVSETPSNNQPKLLF